MKSIKIARIKKELTQCELSKVMGMSIATVSNIETGKKPIDSMKVGDLKKLCVILGLEITEVIGQVI